MTKEDQKNYPVPNLVAYQNHVLDLARSIEQESGRPNQVVCIMTGGMIGGKILAAFWEVPLAVIPFSRYGADDKPLPDDQIYFPKQIINSTARFGDDAILFDDLTDGGMTMAMAEAWLMDEVHGKGKIFKRIRTATIFKKRGEVDHCLVQVQPNPDGSFPWVMHPWDRRRLLTPEELEATRLAAQ